MIPASCSALTNPWTLAALGNKQMIDKRLGKLREPPMFFYERLLWLRMCADFRVLDMMTDENEQVVFAAER